MRLNLEIRARAVNRGRRVGSSAASGSSPASIAHFADPTGDADALVLLAAGLVLGELLVLRLEDRGACRCRTRCSSCSRRRSRSASTRSRCSRAELVSILLRDHRSAAASWRLDDLRRAHRRSRPRPTARTRRAWHLVGQRETVAPVLRRARGRGGRAARRRRDRDARCSASARRSRRAAGSRGWRSRRRAC